jgi:hypothetical protein
MSKVLCLLSFLLNVCYLSLDALTVLPSRELRLSNVRADNELRNKLPKLPKFSPIDFNNIAAGLLVERVRLARIRRSYMELQQLYIACIEELQVIPRYMKIWPDPASCTIQSVSSASRTTASSSSRSVSGASGSEDSSDSSDHTISSHGSGLLSPSSDSSHH